jgi:NAD(P)-dependent dehydrogenase (short-subunit alcohol dehydrogenase family)
MELELSGKAFIITGGTEGLGLALAQSLIAEGAKVAICGRRADKVAEAAALLGPNALALQADVTVTEQLDIFFDQALAAFGRLDGVVNNAGRSAATPLLDSTDEEWREDFELKVIAAVHLIRRAIPELIQNRGAVLNILAVKGKAPDAGSTPTTTSPAYPGTPGQDPPPTTFPSPLHHASHCPSRPGRCLVRPSSCKAL